MISRRLVSASLVAGVLAFTVPAFVVPVEAKSPKKTATKTGEKPAGATGECNDGSYTKAKTQQGACSKHGGVKTWYGHAASTPATTAKAPATAKAAPPSPATAATKPAEKAVVAAPAGAPEGATAKCKDGTYSHSKQHSGACSHHGGVAEWYK